MANRFECENCGKVYKTREKKPKCPACGTAPRRDMRGLAFAAGLLLFVGVIVAVVVLVVK